MALFWKKKQQGSVLWFSRGAEQPAQGVADPRSVPFIVAVVETIAASCESVPLYIRQGDQLLDHHQALDIIRVPNPFANVSLIYFMSMMWDFSGEVFIMIDTSSKGGPWLWPLERSHIVSWPQSPGENWVVAFRNTHRTVPYEDMIRIVRPFPGSLYDGRPWVINALAEEMDMLEALTRYLRAWFSNNGIPPLIVAAQGLDEDQISRYEERWLEKVRGFSRRLVPFFVRGTPDIIQLNNDPPAHLPEFYRIFRDSVLQSFGVPPEIMGIVENSNRATAEAARTLFFVTRIVPRLGIFVTALQQHFVARFWRNAQLVVGKAVPDDKAMQVELLTKLPWIATINEHRAAAGLSPIEGGDVAVADKPVMEAI